MIKILGACVCMCVRVCVCACVCMSVCVCVCACPRLQKQEPTMPPPCMTGAAA